jgi:SAM-dependent methyltransferase
MIKKANKPKKLNLGCGSNIQKGWINLDKSKIRGVDIAHDLDKYPWPFPSSYFEEIYSSDVIEHLDDLFRAMQEIHRISENGAKVRLIVPYWHSSAAFYPNHNYFFNIDSMKFFTERERTYDSFYGFRLEKIRLIPSRIGRLIPPIPLPRSLFPNVLDLRHLVSYLLGEIILKIDFTLRVIKK